MRYRERVTQMEREILKELGFESFRVCEEHPHKMMYHYLNLFKAMYNKQNKEGFAALVRCAVAYLNDAYKTPACLYFPPNTTAAACLYLAFVRLQHA
jgi:thiaminase